MKPDYKVSETPDYLNEVTNHPDVDLGGGFPLDFTPLFNLGITYEYDGGCVCYVNTGYGVYEAHTQALKRARGKPLRDFISWTMEDLFKNKGAQAITSYARHTNPAAKKLSREFLNLDRSDELAEYYRLNREEYLCRQ